jgi:hypothetical protein
MKEIKAIIQPHILSKVMVADLPRVVRIVTAQEQDEAV